MKRVGQVYREGLMNLLKDGVEKSDNVFVLSYTKLSGNKMSELRKSLRKAGASMQVSKNAIAQKTLESLKQEELSKKIQGQTAFVWSKSDSAEISKILVKFVKDCDVVSLRGGLLGNKLLQDTDIKKLSDLPPRAVLLSQLLGTIQAPISRLLGAFNAKSGELLSILKQYSEKKGGS